MYTYRFAKKQQGLACETHCMQAMIAHLRWSRGSRYGIHDDIDLVDNIHAPEFMHWHGTHAYTRLKAGLQP